jgi:chemotaxis methyl-accepting protein methylase
MEFEHFLREVCPPLDLDWRKYRRRAARRRVDRRLLELGLGDYAAYLEVIRGETGEARELADRMRITVSRFFREGQCWEEFASTVLPGLPEGKNRGEVLNIWSAGCCGGEEPYTLAVTILEQYRNEKDFPETAILATDIDEASLQRAGRATYERASIREVPVDLLRRHFLKDDNTWRPVKEAVALITFSRHNLMEDPPPEGMDLICCRYFVFTYYLGQRRREAALRLYQALRPGGILMVGRKEREAVGDLFQPLTKQRTGVFFRKSASPTA